MKRCNTDDCKTEHASKSDYCPECVTARKTQYNNDLRISKMQKQKTMTQGIYMIPTAPIFTGMSGTGNIRA